MKKEYHKKIILTYKSIYKEMIQLNVNRSQLSKAIRFFVQKSGKIVFEKECLEGLKTCQLYLESFKTSPDTVTAAVLSSIESGTMYKQHLEKVLGQKVIYKCEQIQSIKNYILDKQLNLNEKMRLISQHMMHDKELAKLTTVKFMEIAKTVATRPKYLQVHICELAKDLFIPLLHSSGIAKLKASIEDSCMEVSHKEEYIQILKGNLNRLELIKQSFLKSFCDQLLKEVKHLGIGIKVTHRTKSVNSIWKKITSLDMKHEDLHDYIGVRLIVDPKGKDDIDICYQIYDIICSKYEVDHSKTRDWLTMPKDSGYRAIHVTLRHEQNILIEVQIRSNFMHEVAEYGPASHWNYKGNKSKNIEFSEDLIRELKKDYRESDLF